MNIENIIGCFVAACLLLSLVCIAISSYMQRKAENAKPKHNPIIQLWKNTEPRIQVSGKKYLEMLSNL